VPSANETMRRRVVWAAALLLVVGLAGWFGYQAVAGRRAEEARQREEAESLRRLRFHDVFRYMDAIGDAGDAATRAHCREVIQRLAAVEPDSYRMYRGMHPAPAWLSDGP
jgi:hypothetical protein